MRDQALKDANLVLIKVGTSTVMDVDTGLMNLVNVANVVHEVQKLQDSGKKVILVSSGAVGLGRDILLRGSHSKSSEFGGYKYDHAYAAAGQSRLIHLYTVLFDQLNLVCSQILVTETDFRVEDRLGNLKSAVNTLMDHGVIPIINENDAVTANMGFTPDHVFSDNDSLSALIATHMNVDMLICLTDVDGVYTHHPSCQDSKLLNNYFIESDGSDKNGVSMGSKSSVGRGGMAQKILSSIDALKGGVKSVMIMNGHRSGMISRALNGERVGTLLCFKDEQEDDNDNSLEEIARRARDCGMILTTKLTSADRQEMLIDIGNALWDNRQEIIAANQMDIEAAKSSGISDQLQRRLAITEASLRDVVSGIKSLATGEDLLNRELSKLEIAHDLILTKRSCPIGLLLVIFESRPDCLPQIASLALASGNGLLLKGGKEALRTNSILHEVIADTVVRSSKGTVPRDAIALVQSHADVASLLKLDQYISLVVPRGSNQLVRNIKSSTRIPVLGHADGICHIYVDRTARTEMATRILIDAKVNYPAACNAVETILIDESFDDKDQIFQAMTEVGVKLHAGPRLASAYPDCFSKYFSGSLSTLRTEYGDLECSIEIVDNVDGAIVHINDYGSHHTESIVCDDRSAWNKFQAGVKSACVFHNTSTRFADGFRFGLGAEVGVSTSMIHARGPVGVEGLLSEYWTIDTKNLEDSFTVDDFKKGTKTYTHKRLM
eukprot:GHVH01000211.1.p1 GENE.GHVH01000211.1~~GHVH01000211.1.p1  ORF type:complete len:722 (+),score=109.88 GHVH01000211.1:111-2276(+)